MRYATIIITVFFASCVLGNHYSKELPGDFFYLVNGSTDRSILSHRSGGVEIYGNILDFDYDTSYIIVCQKPDFQSNRDHFAFNLRDDTSKYPTNSEAEIESSEYVADSIMRDDPYYKKVFSNDIDYYIVNIKHKNLYGPFTKSEFLSQRIALKVSEKLKLDY